MGPLPKPYPRSRFYVDRHLFPRPLTFPQTLSLTGLFKDLSSENPFSTARPLLFINEIFMNTVHGVSTRNVHVTGVRLLVTPPLPARGRRPGRGSSDLCRRTSALSLASLDVSATNPEGPLRGITGESRGPTRKTHDL